MIEQYAAGASAPEGIEATVVVRPNRSLSLRQFTHLLIGLVIGAVAVAVFSWLQGNVFAPLFVLLDLSLLVGCLCWVWRRGDEIEVIAISAGQVAVRQLPSLEERFRAHPLWVRLDSAEGRLLLCSGNRQVEVGARLGGAERESLALRLVWLLGWAKSGAGSAGAGRSETT